MVEYRNRKYSKFVGHFITVHTNTGKHHVPESTFNYQKALGKICARRCLYSQGLLYCAQLLIKDMHMY